MSKQKSNYVAFVGNTRLLAGVIIIDHIKALTSTGAILADSDTSVTCSLTIAWTVLGGGPVTVGYTLIIALMTLLRRALTASLNTF